MDNASTIRGGYADFLATKKRRHAPAGIEVDLDQVHPMLHGWQREIVQWACQTGRAALFEDCGLGKTFQQVEWARLMVAPTNGRALILAPLTVAKQTVREAAKIGVEVAYVRSDDEAVAALSSSTGCRIAITNYEMADHVHADRFDAVVLDESSILKNVDGRTRQRLTEQFAQVPFRLACTATPAPNDVAELCNHAEFLGVLPRNEMLAAYFVHDDEGWRLKGHAADAMYAWVATWATALRRPSDMGWPDDGYDLPPLNIAAEVVDVDIEPEEGSLLPPVLGGVSGRAEMRRSTLAARVERAVELARHGTEQWIVWCGLNDEAAGIAEGIADAVNVEGSWAPDAKADALEAFQEGRIRVLVTKPSIAGFGMNFQNAHRMAFVGLSDSYEAYYQAIRRCWRFGQTQPVDVHIVVSGPESPIVENVRRKEAEAAVLTDHLIRHMQTREVSLA